MDQALSCEGLLETATVALRIPGGKGSARATGFFIAPKIVATCAHILGEEPGDYEVEAEAGGRQFTLRATTGEYFRTREGLDVALLRLAEQSGPEHGYVLVAERLEIGDRLWTFGFPEGTYEDGAYEGGQPGEFRVRGFFQGPSWC